MSDPRPPFSARQLAEQVLAFREANAPDKHRFSEHALIVDNGRRGSEQKAVIFTCDDLSALLMDLRTAEAEIERLRSRMSEAALNDNCHHCDEAERDDEPCSWCGRIRGPAALVMSLCVAAKGAGR